MAAYLRQVYRREDVEVDPAAFPFNIPWFEDLDITFDSAVTFLVGENGSGKSTLMEALAAKCRLPVGGGGRNELSDQHSPHMKSELAPALRAAFAKQPRTGYFFRAEFQAHFASLLEERAEDPDFSHWGDPFARYGGKSLHYRSHGEAFMAMFRSWLEPGIILMDEPESALSPRRQLELLVRMSDLVREQNAQFIIATHSPIIMTYPGATLWQMDEDGLQKVGLEETSHYIITKDILTRPEQYWRYLLGED